MTQQPQPYRPAHPIRVVTAASLFDGHDAAINIIRRILQGTGVEVIHLGHNRAVHECVEAAIQEDAHAIGLSCYQGGHMEFFKYAVDLLRERGAGHIKVFGGGGGVIVPEEAAELEQYGVAKIYTPEDGRRLGLQGIINHFVEGLDDPLGPDDGPELVERLAPEEPFAVARAITCVERAAGAGDGGLEAWREALAGRLRPGKAPVLGVTGTGGSGKSSLTDELMIRLLADFPELRVTASA
jgi:methylmalonyl-CoA mutase